MSEDKKDGFEDFKVRFRGGQEDFIVSAYSLKNAREVAAAKHCRKISDICYCVRVTSERRKFRQSLKW